MSTATTTLLPNPQWRLVNLLWRKAAYTAARRLSTALTVADASTDDLVELIDGDLATIDTNRYAGHGADLTHDMRELTGPFRLSVYDDPHLFLRLTAAGMKWVAANPANLVLHSIAEHDGGVRGAIAGDVQRDTGIDLPDYLAAFIERGLICASTNAGEPVDAAEVRGWRHTSTALHKSRIRLTHAGRRIVNP